jgi:Uma2 family endonuclease
LQECLVKDRSEYRRGVNHPPLLYHTRSRQSSSVQSFCKDHNLSCHTSGGDGAYAVRGNVVAPDFAYKPTPMSDEYPDPEPPLWVVEIISPTDKASDIRDKRTICRQASILLWEIYPPSQSVDVYAPGQPLRECGERPFSR